MPCRPLRANTMVGRAKPIHIILLAKNDRPSDSSLAISTGRLTSGKLSFSLSIHCRRMIEAMKAHESNMATTTMSHQPMGPSHGCQGMGAPGLRPS